MNPATLPSRLSDTHLEDPSGTLRLLPPLPPPMPPRGLDSGSDSAGATKFLNYLRYRWVMIFFLGGMLGTMFAATAYKVIPARYTTTAMLRVFMDSQAIFSLENPASRTDFAIYVKTQAQILRSHFVLSAALRDPEIAGFPMLREQVDPVRWLEEELKIETAEGSEIIRVSLSGEDPVAVSKIVNAIVTAFDQEIIQDETNRKKVRLVALQNQIVDMQQGVTKEHTNRKITKAPEKPKTDFDPVMPKQMAEGELVRNRRELSAVESMLKRLEELSNTLEKQLHSPAEELPPVSVDILDNEPKIALISRRLEEVKKNHAYFRDRFNTPSDNPAMVQYRDEIERLTNDRGEMRKTRQTEMQKPALFAYTRKIQEEIDKTKLEKSRYEGLKLDLEKTIRKNIEDLANQVDKIDEPIDVDRVSMRDREQLIVRMKDKESILKMEAKAPPRVTIFQNAAVPLKQEMKKQLIGTIAAGLFGFALVGLGVVVYESRIQRALSLSEVRTCLHAPMVGILPGSAQPGVRPDAILTAESVEKTRTHVLRQFGRSGSRIILITSATHEEGKSTIAWHLATSFARTGARTILVDADLRTPRMHSILGVPNERGICEILTGQIDYRVALQQFPNGLTLLPAGKWADAVRTELVPDKVNMLLQKLRENYDYIVIHSHPLLSVAESYLLAQFSDGVLLTVERNETRLPLATRAMEKISSLAPECTGVVYLGASPEECLN